MNADFRVPPHSVEAEQSLIGGLLIGGPASWDRIVDAVTDGDFYRDDHRRIFSHIRTLANTAKPVDVVTVADAIERSSETDQTGGLAYLAEIANATPSAANILRYAEIIAQNSVRRRLVHVAGQIGEIAHGKGDARTALDEAQRLLSDVADSGPSKAEPVAIGQVLGAVIEGIEQRMLSESLLAGLPTGFADLDQKLSGLRPGNLIIIAGRPSMGKTAFALNIAEHVAVVARKPVAVFSLEMSGEELGHRSISSLGGVSIERLISGKQLDDDDWERMTVALGKLHEAPLVIDDSAGLTISQIAARARRIKRRQGLSLIVVDYLQLMGGETDNRTGNRNLELGDLTRRLKALAKDLHVPVIALSQLSRKVEDRPNKRPMMSDLRDSGSIEQDADVILMVYRDEYYNPASSEAGTAEILIAKNRMGATGDVMLAFQGEFCRFRSLTRDAVSRIAHARVTSQVQKPRKRGFND